MLLRSIDNENELLLRIAQGDSVAFKVVYEKFNKKTYTVVLKILKSPMLAEEITQEVFLKLWRQEQQIKDFDHLEAWLRTVARNLSLNAFRKLVLEKKLRLQAGHQFNEPHNDTEEAILLRDARKVLEAAIEKLPAQQREVYVLCQQEGLKYEEVAERLNISINTVKTHMKRALVSIRIYMKTRIDIVILIILLKLF